MGSAKKYSLELRPRKETPKTLYKNRKRVLLICHYGEGTAETIFEHIDAFDKYSRHEIYVLKVFGDLPDFFPIHIFDVVVIHYSICIGRGGFLSIKTKKIIRDFAGRKILYIQDDYRWINSTIANCIYMGIDVIFGLANQDIVPKIYSKRLLPGVQIKTVLTGYVSDEMLAQKSPPYSKRSIDVSYRARKLPFWMGSHTLQKWQIAEKFLTDVKGMGLVCDVSINDEDRLYGEAWKDLLNNSKAVLGTESGVNVCDFTGEIQIQVEDYVSKHPDATFDEVKNKFLKNEDDRIRMNVISPRIFESIACRNLLVLYPGEYSGVLREGRHYVMLNHDHSNLGDVIKIIKTPSKAQEIINNAYREILLNPAYHYKALIKDFDDAIDKARYKKNLNILRNIFNNSHMNVADLIERETAKAKRKSFKNYLWSTIRDVIKILSETKDKINIEAKRCRTTYQQHRKTIKNHLKVYSSYIKVYLCKIVNGTISFYRNKSQQVGQQVSKNVALLKSVIKKTYRIIIENGNIVFRNFVKAAKRLIIAFWNMIYITIANLVRWFSFILFKFMVGFCEVFIKVIINTIRICFYVVWLLPIKILNISLISIYRWINITFNNAAYIICQFYKIIVDAYSNHRDSIRKSDLLVDLCNSKFLSIKLIRTLDSNNREDIGLYVYLSQETPNVQEYVHESRKLIKKRMLGEGVLRNEMSIQYSQMSLCFFDSIPISANKVVSIDVFKRLYKHIT